MIVGGTQYKVHGDYDYNLQLFMELPFEGIGLHANQKALSTSISRVRITVEWNLTEVKLYLPIVETKRRMKLCESLVGLLYLERFFRCKVRECMYPHQFLNTSKCACQPWRGILVIGINLHLQKRITKSFAGDRRLAQGKRLPLFRTAKRFIEPPANHPLASLNH